MPRAVAAGLGPLLPQLQNQDPRGLSSQHQECYSPELGATKVLVRAGDPAVRRAGGWGNRRETESLG